MFLLARILAYRVIFSSDIIASAIIAESNVLTLLFGSFAGIAALMMALLQVQIRRDQKKREAQEATHVDRMDTFEVSQTSMAAALTRADQENEKLRGRIGTCDEQILKFKSEIIELKQQLLNADAINEGLRRSVEAHETKIAELQRTITTLETAHQQEVAELHAQIEELIDGRYK